MFNYWSSVFIFCISKICFNAKQTFTTPQASIFSKLFFNLFIMFKVILCYVKTSAGLWQFFHKVSVITVTQIQKVERNLDTDGS